MRGPSPSTTSPNPVNTEERATIRGNPHAGAESERYSAQRRPGFSKRCYSRLAEPPQYQFHPLPGCRGTAESRSIIYISHVHWEVHFYLIAAPHSGHTPLVLPVRL
jgi:hypothetical protein